MDKYDLIGSPSRDAFKYWHKQKRGQYYGGDIDFFLCQKFLRHKKKEGGIVAILDFKTRTEKLTFVEVLAFNDFLAKGYKVFIVRANVKMQRARCPKCQTQLPRSLAMEIDRENSFTSFTIQEYVGGDWRPYPNPKAELELVEQDISEDEYWEWEDRIREQYVDEETNKVESRL